MFTRTMDLHPCSNRFHIIEYKVRKEIKNKTNNLPLTETQLLSWNGTSIDLPPPSTDNPLIKGKIGASKYQNPGIDLNNVPSVTSMDEQLQVVLSNVFGGGSNDY